MNFKEEIFPAFVFILNRIFGVFIAEIFAAINNHSL